MIKPSIFLVCIKWGTATSGDDISYAIYRLPQIKVFMTLENYGYLVFDKESLKTISFFGILVKAFPVVMPSPFFREEWMMDEYKLMFIYVYILNLTEPLSAIHIAQQ